MYHPLLGRATNSTSLETQKLEQNVIFFYPLSYDEIVRTSGKLYIYLSV